MYVCMHVAYKRDCLHVCEYVYTLSNAFTVCTVSVEKVFPVDYVCMYVLCK